MTTSGLACLEQSDNSGSHFIRLGIKSIALKLFGARGKIAIRSNAGRSGFWLHDHSA
jgi:hypothetical protein